jgi:hypothetical protein
VDTANDTAVTGSSWGGAVVVAFAAPSAANVVVGSDDTKLLLEISCATTSGMIVIGETGSSEKGKT